MSTLQISLAVVGGLVLAGVVAQGAWSARKNLPKQATPKEPKEPQEKKEPQAGTEPLGQVLAASGGALGADAGGDALPERHEPSFDADSDMSALKALAQLTTLDKKPGLDVLLDAMASVALEGLASGDAALAAMPGTWRVGSKPFGVEGLSAVSGEWEFPVAGERYSAFQCGVQLANRTGALNQIEYSEFVITTQAFADALDGVAEFRDMQDEVARARELDQFASAHDAQLSFTLSANRSAWSPGYVQQNAATWGFVVGVIPGRMVLPASEPGHPAILGLAFDAQAALADEPEQTALRELTLSLDVPQVLRSERPFARMCEVAIGLATAMDGVIIDDNGNPITTQAMETIHADLENLYDKLDGREMSAGSVLGRRLFS